MDLLSLWGKTLPDGAYHPLLYHMLDVAAVVEALHGRFDWVRVLPPDVLMYVAALHDLGKADPYFQNKAPEQVERLRKDGETLPLSLAPYRHEARSAEWVLEHLREAWAWGGEEPIIVSDVLHAHHGRLQCDMGTTDDSRDPLVSRWASIRDQLAERVHAVLAPAPWQPQAFPHAGAAGIQLSGLLVLADWIASNERVYHYLDLPQDVDDGTYLLAARAEAAQAVKTLGFSADTMPSSLASVSFSALWPACTELRPSQDALQTVLHDDPPPPGLAIIEAPMGEGKTEAAIYLAEHWRHTAGKSGTYIALPTGATSNQMYGRYQQFLSRVHPGVAPRLVHGMAWLIDGETPEDGNLPATDEEQDVRETARGWFRPSRRALLAPEAVGTIDQALLAALNVKFGFLRLFGLADKVLVIDEVHAYDVYMTTILRRLLAWCRALEIPVILLSATLSAKQRETLVCAYQGTKIAEHAVDGTATPYPLLTFVPPLGETRHVGVASDAMARTVGLRLHTATPDAMPATAAGLAVEAVSEGGCACVIMNTVVDAQRAFKEVQRLAQPGTTCLLFHARFRPEVRQHLEKQVTTLFGKDGNRPERAILVATQVVEQSLDVDFDVMITSLAPIDLLLQRSGRLWRHQRAGRPVDGPVLQVIMPDGDDFGGSGYVYQHAPLLHTQSLLLAREEIVLPRDFRPLIEGCYGPNPATTSIDPARLEAAYNKLEDERGDEENQARCHLIAEPHPEQFLLTARAPVDEDEAGSTTDYFHARTRLGRQTRSVLILHDDDLLTMAHGTKAPNRARLQRLFMQKVDLPAWWFTGLVDDAGELIDPGGPSWLRGCQVLPMKNGAWRAWNGRGDPVTITDDPMLGLVFTSEKEQSDDV